MWTDLLPFPGGLWVGDAEYRQPEGDPLPVEVHCIVLHECRSGRTCRFWSDTLERRDAPPVPLGPEALFICYSAHAELQAFQAVGWPVPGNVFDVMAESLLVTNRTRIPGQAPPGSRLVDMLRFFGLVHRLDLEKPELQKLAQRGGPYTGDERTALLEYCEADVLVLEALMPRLLERIRHHHQDWPRYLRRALFRGDYMKATSEMQRRGVPLDTPLLQQVQEHWDAIRLDLIAQTDATFGVYQGTTFKQDRFAAYLKGQDIGWPLTQSGRLCMDEDTWKAMVTLHPQLHPLKELVATLGKLKLNALTIGPDGRNRAYLRPFGSNTARNQPSNSRFIFGPATWIRGFIRPRGGRVLLYMDWKSQEIGIAAALSQDPNLIQDYCAGDFYLNFGTRNGFLPDGATKATHANERDLLKQVCLGLGYGLGALRMGAQLDTDLYLIRKWIRGHKLRYRVFWSWLDDVVSSAFARGWIRSRLGWQTRVLEEARATSVMNWSMQTGGSDMLRTAAVLATRQGLALVAPIHDALLLEAPAHDWQDHAATLRHCMEEASRLTLSQRLTVPVEGWDAPVCYPDRYMDEKRGRRTWDTVMQALARARTQGRARG